MSDFFALYDTIIQGIDPAACAEACFLGNRWAMASSNGQLGIAMATHGNTIPPMWPHKEERFLLRQAASGIKSWNLDEASILSAACNAYYNSTDRLKELNCYEPFENYCTDGLDLAGAKIALIGHLNIPEEMRKAAESISILERAPKPGDYPDSACDWILPGCDVVIITGSSLINKTLPHLLDLCRNAYTILAGPSVPMCPELLEHGIDRLAGMVVSDPEAMTRQVRSGAEGTPYRFGAPFLLRK